MRRTPPYLTLLAAALLLAASALPAAAGPGFDVGARGIYWFPSVSGGLDTGDGEIDLESDLGLDRESIPGVEAFARVLWFGVRGGYMPVKIDGEKRTGTIPDFDLTSFSNLRVATEVDLETADLELSFAPKITVPWLANLYAGAMLKTKIVDGTVTLANLDGAAPREELEFKGFVPMVGLLAGAGVLNDVVRLDARLAGMAWSGHHIYDGDVCLSVSPFDPPVVDLKLQGGYKFIDLDLKDGNLEATLRIAGPYAGLQLDF